MMSLKSIFALSGLVLLAEAAPWKPTTTTDCTTTTLPTSTWQPTSPTTTSPWQPPPPTSTPCPPTTTTTSPWQPPPPTSTPCPPTTTTTGVSPTPTGNNGQGFLNQCENLGLSILDCTELGNIAALNGNTINVGGTTAGGSTAPVNNGQQFINQCGNFGISIANCAELLNIAILNGNTVDISLADLTALISSLGLSPAILSGIVISPNGLITLAPGLL